MIKFRTFCPLSFLFVLFFVLFFKLEKWYDRYTCHSCSNGLATSNCQFSEMLFYMFINWALITAACTLCKKLRDTILSSSLYIILEQVHLDRWNYHVTSHIFINIFQTVHFSAVKFIRGDEENMSFLLIPKSLKVWEKSEAIRPGHL